MGPRGLLVKVGGNQGHGQKIGRTTKYLNQVQIFQWGVFSPATLRCFGNNIFAKTSKKSMAIQQTSHPTTRQCQCTHMNTITSKVSLRIPGDPSLQFAPRKTQIRLIFATPPQVVAFESWTISAPISLNRLTLAESRKSDLWTCVCVLPVPLLPLLSW